MKRPPQIIGWREWVELPEWGLRLRGKVDTGAKSSSIDVTDVVVLPGDRVQFRVRLSKTKNSNRVLSANIHRVSRVKSSNGEVQERIVVKTTLVMAAVQKEILINLSCRKRMIHRLLLGREALKDDFLIAAGVDHLVDR